MRRLWAHLIRRVYEVDPLLCQHCGASMRVLAFVLEPAAVRKILAHLAAKLRAVEADDPEQLPRAR